MASLSIGFLEAALLYTREWCRKETAATYTCMVLGFMDWLRWTANRVIVSFVPGTGISLKAWQKPW